MPCGEHVTRASVEGTFGVAEGQQHVNNKAELLRLRANPWHPHGAPMGGADDLGHEQAARQREQVAERMPITSARKRPLVPDCAACAVHGQSGHGKKHSVACKQRFQQWLAAQEQPEPPRSVEVGRPSDVAMEDMRTPLERLDQVLCDWHQKLRRREQYVAD